MNNFTYHNPVKIVFGKNTIAKIKDLIPANNKVLITYGGGSIKKNGVYDQVMKALSGYNVLEFGGIEANPDFNTLIKAVDLCKKEKVDFLLSVGGGSVLDGTKFIAAAVNYNGDPWEILTQKKSGKITKALPIGCVLTLAATGSEMNGFAVISRRETGEKLSFGSPLLFPQFSILDPQTTVSLSSHQTANGIVDAFIHVMEQYLTYDVNTPLQDRQSEAILKTLIETAPIVMNNPDDLDARANIMWCATQALNGLIACGVVQDWSTHMIGHELTAAYGLDHARSLAIVFPAIIENQKSRKFNKFIQYGKRTWHVIPADENNENDLNKAFDKVFNKTIDFFHSLGVKTKLSDSDLIPEKWAVNPEQTFEIIADRISKRGLKLGEHKNIGYDEIKEILNKCWK
ncbi:MAG: iron-containing alcohol dehydrogenase [Spirochaetia bacterium]|nr:iron-containing alcohol dehydrogenase [Spirochaetia bacterium]